LNDTAGGKTPFASIIVVCVILIALELLTSSFEYIPYSALAGIIFVAITNLISIHDFWEAWKYSRKDFFTMNVTFFIVLLFDTTIGLIVGLACALLVFLTDVVFSKHNRPILIDDSRNNGIYVIKLGSDINFLTSDRIKIFISSLTIKEPENPNVNDVSRGEYYHYVVSYYFDKILRPRLTIGVDVLPLAIVIDLSIVRVVDITGIETFKEIIHEARLKGILIVIINANSFLERILERCNIKNDCSTNLINLDEYLILSNLPIRTVNNNQNLSDPSNPIDLEVQTNHFDLQDIDLEQNNDVDEINIHSV
jgi:MFS superfamily sulfate permease-like transporter